MLSKISLITTFNLYESKRYFAQKFSEALQRAGIETQILDWESYQSKQDLLSDLMSFRPDLTCSFNTIQPLPDKQFLWDKLRLPHLAILVDPALYSVELVNSSYSIIACVDRQDCAALRSIPFHNVIFFPHAVERELNYDRQQARKYDVVFLGSCNDYEGVRKEWQSKYPAVVGTVLDSASELVLSDRYISLAEALTFAINQQPFDNASIDFATLFSYLDTYTRGKDRVNLIRSIKDPAVKIHIFGQAETERFSNAQHDWTYYVGSQSNVILHPSVPFTESLQILRQSKICLNSMPFFKDGTHERVFCSLACGCLPLTSSTRYLAEQFQEGKEILMYQPSKWNKVNDLIVDVLKNEKQRQLIAEQGRKKLMQHHTWDNRVEQLITNWKTLFS